MLPAARPPEGGLAPARRAVFVYYKLAADKVPCLMKAFSGLVLASMSAAPVPWEAELMRRSNACASSSDLQTWMEIYWLHDAAGRDHAAFRQMIEGRARAAGILDLIDGDRHYEVFESCA